MIFSTIFWLTVSPVVLLASFFTAEWVLLQVRAPHIQLHHHSDAQRPARIWRSAVWYDRWGTPYATGEDARCIRLRPNGGTDNPHRAEWKHVSGPAVDFDKAMSRWNWPVFWVGLAVGGFLVGALWFTARFV